MDGLYDTMRVEALCWLLKEIKKGNNTSYSLEKAKSSVIRKHLIWAKNKKLIKQTREGQKRPYILTPKGEQALKSLS